MTALEAVDRRLRARAGALLFAVAGAIGLLALLLPGGAGSSLLGALITSLASLALGGLLWALGERLPGLAYQGLLAAASLLVAVSASYGGDEGWLNGFYYFWIALFVAYFFPPRWVVAQLALATFGYGLVAALSDWQHRELIWFLTITTVCTMAALVAFLRLRLDESLAVEREQLEQLQELDRLRSEFMATVSHELRTPVAAVFGAAATLMHHQLEPAVRDELIRLSYAEARRLATLTDDILQSTSIEQERMRLELEAVDPLEVALAVVEALRVSEGRPLRLNAPEEVAPVRADKKRLEQVLMNLVDNAFKYSPPGEPVELEIAEHDDAVCLIVKDQGPGIPEESRELVFEQFHRLDPNMHNGVGGSGLGLYIVKGLVDSMQGRVWIGEGDQGRGAAVAVELSKLAA